MTYWETHLTKIKYCKTLFTELNLHSLTFSFGAIKLIYPSWVCHLFKGGYSLTLYLGPVVFVKIVVTCIMSSSWYIIYKSMPEIMYATLIMCDVHIVSVWRHKFTSSMDIREVKHTNVYVNVYVCLGICAYYVIMTSSVLNAAKIYKLFITCKL